MGPVPAKSKKKGLIATPSIVPQSIIESGYPVDCELADEQITWLSSDYLVHGRPEEVQFIFELYVKGLTHSKRKQIIKAINVIFSNHITWIEDYVFPTFVESLRNTDRLIQLAACIDGPDSSIVTDKFINWVPERAVLILSNLINMLSEWANRDQPELLLIARLIQSISNLIGGLDISRLSTLVCDKLHKALYGILENHHADSSRDLTTVVGHLYCLYFKNRINSDMSGWKPMAKMSIKRAITALCRLDNIHESVLFYASFLTNETSAMDLHYAIQSIQLLLSGLKRSKQSLTSEAGKAIVEICLNRWDHPLHMVSANCRALFQQVCEACSHDLLEWIINKAESAPVGSKKRFNVLFGLVPHIEIMAIANRSLINEIMDCMRKWCPSVTAASGLLEVLLVKTNGSYLILPWLMDYIFCLTDDDFDWEQFISAIRTGKALDTFVSRLLENKERFGNQKKVLLHIARQTNAELLNVTEIQQMALSCDPSTASAALAVVLSLIAKSSPDTNQSLVDIFVNFLTKGGILTVSSSKDDRSCVVQEFKKFFDSASDKKLEYTKKQLFSLIVDQCLQPDVLQDEGLLGVELMACLRENRLWDLVSRHTVLEPLFANVLQSRWRKMRIAGRQIVNTLIWDKKNLLKESNIVQYYYEKIVFGEDKAMSEELLGSVLDLVSPYVSELTEHIVKAPIDSPNIQLLIGVGNMTNRFPLPEIESYLLAVMVYHSQFVGEECIEAVTMNSNGLLMDYEGFLIKHRFKGKGVDCRGHPIMDSDEKAIGISIRAWTSARAAALALRPSANLPIVAKIIAILLLSVKHPAEIAPLELVFSTCLSLMDMSTISEDLLVPLVGSVTGMTSNSSFFTLPVPLRRSQGLGPLISSIVKALGTVSAVLAVTDRLIAVVNSANDDSEQVLHSLNVLTSLARDSSVPDQLLDSVIGPMMVAALDALLRLSKDYWRVRSSATQLFVQAARRFIGSDNEDLKAQKKISATEFFFNRTKAGEKLIGEMLQVIVSSDPGAIVPVLSVIQYLTNLDELNNSEAGALLLESIEALIGHSCAHIRRLSARILAKMHTDGDNEWLVPKSGDSLNMYHGKLVYWWYKGVTRRVFDDSIEWRTCPLIQNELISLSVKSGRGIPQQASPKDVLRWIASLSEGDVARDEQLSRAVVESITEVNHPIYRDLMMSAISAYPYMIVESKLTDLLNEWYACDFSMGILVLLIIAHSQGWHVDENRVKQWLNGIDIVVETVGEEFKQKLAKSDMVQKISPLMHALLLLDESATVRMAACINGMNCLVSFENVVKKLSEDELSVVFFEEFTKYAGRTDVVIEYSIRASAYKIVNREFLHTTRQ